MKSIIVFLFILSSSTSFGARLNIDFKALYHSSTLNAVHTNGSKGELVTKASFDPALSVGFQFAARWKIFASFKNITSNFDNTKDVIAEETNFSTNSQSLGLQWIFLKSVAFRLLYTSEEIFGFVVDTSDKAVLFKESISYPTFFYDQILYMNSSFYLGFQLGVDVPVSGQTLKNRSGTRLGVFYKTGGFGLSAELNGHKVEVDDWEYEAQARIYELSYSLSF